MAETNAPAAKPETVAEVKTVLNIRNVTTIPNSISEFNIYTYKAESDTTASIKNPGFFNPGHSIFEVGDVIRVFQLERDIASGVIEIKDANGNAIIDTSRVDYILEEYFEKRDE